MNRLSGNAALCMLCLAGLAYSVRELAEVRKDAARQEIVEVTVLDTRMKIDWFPGDSSNRARPIHELALQLKWNDGSERVVSWEGETGQAVYPEEWLDEFAHFAPGTVHRVAVHQGRPREVRFYGIDNNRDMGRYFIHLGLALFCGLNALVFGAIALAAFQVRQTMLGFWTVCVSSGVALLIFIGALLTEKANGLDQYRQVKVEKYGPVSPFDLSELPEGVTITAAARGGLKDWEYQRYRYEQDGRTYRLGTSFKDEGVLDSVHAHNNLDDDPFVIFVRQGDRWNFTGGNSFGQQVVVPGVILGAFALVPLGLGLVLWFEQRKKR